jgi:hypothetical protein
VNLGLRFLLEVAGYLLAGYAAYVRTAGLPEPVRWTFAVGTTVAVIVIWALTVAPRRQNGLSQGQKDIIGTVMLLVVAAAVALSGQPVFALEYAVVLVVNAVLLRVSGDDVRKRFS